LDGFLYLATKMREEFFPIALNSASDFLRQEMGK
jgi:hypothetical protein